MLLNEDPNRGSYLDSIDKVKSTELRKIASKYFSKNRYVIVTIVPKKKNN
jgi:predicted Zn-dependent peptidase